MRGKNQRRFKASETLLGIETNLVIGSSRSRGGFKASETLLGIETNTAFPWVDNAPASKPLKPF